MDEARAIGVADNEVFFGDVNETLVDSGRGDSDPLIVICERGDADCSERITVPKALYLRVRADAECFLVKAGH